MGGPPCARAGMGRSWPCALQEARWRVQREGGACGRRSRRARAGRPGAAGGAPACRQRGTPHAACGACPASASQTRRTPWRGRRGACGRVAREVRAARVRRTPAAGMRGSCCRAPPTAVTVAQPQPPNQRLGNDLARFSPADGEWACRTGGGGEHGSSGIELSRPPKHITVFLCCGHQLDQGHPQLLRVTAPCGARWPPTAAPPPHAPSQAYDNFTQASSQVGRLLGVQSLANAPQVLLGLLQSRNVQSRRLAAAGVVLCSTKCARAGAQVGMGGAGRSGHAQLLRETLPGRGGS